MAQEDGGCMVDRETTRLIQETVARFVSPHARVARVLPAAMASHEQGWSGAKIARFRVSLRDGASLTLLTKTMGLKERRVMDRLTRQGHAHTPFTHALDLEADSPVLSCMQDLGTEKVGIPIQDDAPLSADLDAQVAAALADIHTRHLGCAAELSWLPHADVAYVTGFLLPEMWRARWDQALASNREFAHEFARYTPQLEEAGARFARAVRVLWDEGTSLTLTHGELHGEHVVLWRGRPYFLDWGWAYYGPFYLDLPAYFTPRTVHRYRNALAQRGVDIAEADFMEHYHEMGRYIGFRYLCGGIWEWQNAPGSVIGRRLLLAIRWALDGTWQHRALAVPDGAWRQLLAAHQAANCERQLDVD